MEVKELRDRNERLEDAVDILKKKYEQDMLAQSEVVSMLTWELKKHKPR